MHGSFCPRTSLSPGCQLTYPQKTDKALPVAKGLIGDGAIPSPKLGRRRNMQFKDEWQQAGHLLAMISFSHAIWSMCRRLKGQILIQPSLSVLGSVGKNLWRPGCFLGQSFV